MPWCRSRSSTYRCVWQFPLAVLNNWWLGSTLLTLASPQPPTTFCFSNTVQNFINEFETVLLQLAPSSLQFVLTHPFLQLVSTAAFRFPTPPPLQGLQRDRQSLSSQLARAGPDTLARLTSELAAARAAGADVSMLKEQGEHARKQWQEAERRLAEAQVGGRMEGAYRREAVPCHSIHLFLSILGEQVKLAAPDCATQGTPALNQRG